MNLKHDLMSFVIRSGNQPQISIYEKAPTGIKLQQNPNSVLVMYGLKVPRTGKGADHLE